MKLIYDQDKKAWVATGRSGGTAWTVEGKTFIEAWKAGITTMLTLNKRAKEQANAV